MSNTNSNKSDDEEATMAATEAIRSDVVSCLCTLESLLDDPSFHLNDVLERLRNQIDLRAEIEKQERMLQHQQKLKQQQDEQQQQQTFNDDDNGEELVNRWRDVLFDCLEHFKRMCQSVLAKDTASPLVLDFLVELKEAVRLAKDKLSTFDDGQELRALLLDMSEYLNELRQIIVCYRVCEFLSSLSSATTTTGEQQPSTSTYYHVVEENNLTPLSTAASSPTNSGGANKSFIFDANTSFLRNNTNLMNLSSRATTAPKRRSILLGSGNDSTTNSSNSVESKHFQIANELGQLRIYECFELNGKTIRLYYNSSSSNSDKENLEILNRSLRLIRTRCFASYNKQVRSIVIRNSGHFAIEPDAFADLHALTQLTIAYNRITTCAELRNCYSLRTLVLSNNNRLTHLDTNTCFTGCPALTHLDLGSNRLETLDETLLRPLVSLQVLSLANNVLADRLPAGVFRGLRALVRLDLSNNKLTAIEPGTFGEDLIALQVLLLAQNKLESFEAACFSECGLPSLQRLDLSNNSLVHLKRGTFASLKSLQVLLLQFNRIAEVETGAFAGLAQLRELSLGYNELADLDRQKLGGGLGQLRRLELMHNKLGRLRAEMFHDMRGSLQTLVLHSNRIEEIEARAFHEMTRLTRLDLHKNRLRTLMVTRVVRTSATSMTTITTTAFTPLSALEELVLSENELAAIDYKYTFVGLEDNLRELHLGYNRLERLELEALSRLRQLQCLDLRANQLPSETIKALNKHFFQFKEKITLNF